MLDADTHKTDETAPPNPADQVVPLERHLENRWTFFKRDTQEGLGAVSFFHDLARKYPNAPKDWGWQYALECGGRAVRSHLDAILGSDLATSPDRTTPAPANRYELIPATVGSGDSTGSDWTYPKLCRRSVPLDGDTELAP